MTANRFRKNPLSTLVEVSIVVLILATLACDQKVQTPEKVIVPPSDQAAAELLAKVQTPDGVDILSLFAIVKTYPGTKEEIEAKSRLSSLRIPSEAPLFLAISSMEKFRLDDFESALKNYSGTNKATVRAIRARMSSKDYKERLERHKEEEAFTARICKAAIAKIMGRDPRIIKTWTEHGVTKLGYRRPDDNKWWDYKCRLQDSLVVWGGSDSDRWRDLPEDGTLEFSVTGTGKNSSVTIKEKYDGELFSEETFTFSQLR